MQIITVNTGNVNYIQVIYLNPRDRAKWSMGNVTANWLVMSTYFSKPSLHTCMRSSVIIIASKFHKMDESVVISIQQNFATFSCVCVGDRCVD